MRKLPWFEIALVVAIMSISVYAAFSDPQNLSLRWFTRDDAYYYFKVAQNISEGKGSTFDGINPTNGYHPLWMLVCIPIFALARFDLVLPLKILLLVMSALSAATGILIYRLLGRAAHPAIGAFAAVYWALDFQNISRIYKPGLETGIAAFFIILLAYKLFDFEQTWRKDNAVKKQLFLLGIIAALAMLSRLDLVFLAVIVGLWVVLRGHPLRYFLPLDLLASASAVLLAFILRLSMREYYRYDDAALTMLALSVVVSLTFAYFLGLYQRDVLKRITSLMWRLGLLAAGTSALVGVLMILIARAADFEVFPRAVIPIHAALTFLLFGLTRLAYLGLQTGPAPEPDPTPVALLRQNWRRWLEDGIAYYGVVFGALGAYMIINKILFGTFSPISGQFKRWWGSFPSRVYGGTAPTPAAFFGIDYEGHANAWQPVSTALGTWAEALAPFTGMEAMHIYLVSLAILGMLFYAVLKFNGNKARNAVIGMGIIPFFSAAVLQILSYHAPGYAAYRDWYWIVHPLLGILVLGSMAGLAAKRILKPRYIQAGLWILILGFGVLSANNLLRNLQGLMQYGRWSADVPNSEIAHFLEQHTEPGSIIGMTGGGNAGYFIQDRTVVNMDGLINRTEYFEAVRNGAGGQFLLDLGMDYALVNLDFVTRQPYNGQFNPYMETMDLYVHVFELFRYSVPDHP